MLFWTLGSGNSLDLLPAFLLGAGVLPIDAKAPMSSYLPEPVSLTRN